MSDPRTDVIKKALTDAKFKADLLKNPAAALEKAYGVKVPAGTTVKVVEDTASVVHLVLPASGAAGRGLSDAELESAAGGASTGTKPLILPGCQSTGMCIP